MLSGISVEAVRTRQLWERLVIEAATAGPTPPVAAKKFKPKFPGIPVRDDYRRPADTEFWIEFPTNFNCPGKPSLIKEIEMVGGRVRLLRYRTAAAGTAVHRGRRRHRM